MNTVPKIEYEFFEKARDAKEGGLWLDIANKALELQYSAEHQAQQEGEYITAEQARELGADAEFQSKSPPYLWITCDENCCYEDYFKYRAIKKLEPVDRHAALRAEYAKQVKEGTVGFYLWEVKCCGEKYFREIKDGLGCFYTENEYRCTDIRKNHE